MTVVSGLWMRMKATLDELLCSVELLEGDSTVRDVINKHISEQTQVSPVGQTEGTGWLFFAVQMVLFQ